MPKSRELEWLEFYLHRASEMQKDGTLRGNKHDQLFYDVAEALRDSGPGVDLALMIQLEEFFEKYPRKRSISRQGVSADGRKLTEVRERVTREHLAEHLGWEIPYKTKDGAVGDASSTVVEAIYVLLTALAVNRYIRIGKCESQRCGKLFLYEFQGRVKRHCSDLCRTHHFRDGRR